MGLSLIAHQNKYNIKITQNHPKMKTKKTDKVKSPLNIRNELRMLCAMKGYSNMKGSKGKTLMQQHDALYIFYHGKVPSRSSQIKILCSGGYGYRDIYDSVRKVATSKNDTVDTMEELVLKKDLHGDPARVFFVRLRRSIIST